MNYPYTGYTAPYLNFTQYQNPIQDNLGMLRQQPQQQDERIWVQNRGAADSYLMAPNSFVRLWDSQRPVFYEKRSDASGRPSMEVYEYKQMVVEENLQPVGNSDRLDAIERRLAALEGRQHESDADDSTVPSVPKSVSRRSKAAGTGPAEQRSDDTAAV